MILSFSIAALVTLGMSLPAKAENVCEVTDPTGTPLNVRDTPNGRVINALRNGRELYIIAIAYDRKNRPWAKVGGYYQGEYRIWGWVSREFISCYNR
ncbi:MAG: SH3 domain-containing protein [Okeania sp. SIO2D1]|nr:SH3 domain-containing protein [Okeania sp. SIO2D1]